MKDILLGAVGFAACVLALYVVNLKATDTPDPLGSGSQDNYTTQYFNAGMVEAGITATQTAGSVILPFSAFDEEKVVVALPTSATTFTLPASSTMAGIIPTPGMTKTFIIHNRGTSTSNSITIAGATGVALKKATTSAVMAGDADGSSFMEVTLTRLFNGNLSAGVKILAD